MWRGTTQDLYFDTVYESASQRVVLSNPMWGRQGIIQCWLAYRPWTCWTLCCPCGVMCVNVPLMHQHIHPDQYLIILSVWLASISSCHWAYFMTYKLLSDTSHRGSGTLQNEDLITWTTLLQSCTIICTGSRPSLKAPRQFTQNAFLWKEDKSIGPGLTNS